MSTPLNLLFYGGQTSAWVEHVSQQLGDGWTISHWSEYDDPNALKELAPTADVIVGGRFAAGDFPALAKLKLYHIPFTGFDWVDQSALPSGCKVCNTFEHEIAIAEYVMAGLLDMEVGVAGMSAHFKSHGWEGRKPGMGPGRRELYGGTLGIVGYGHIGREVAKRARAFGMRVHAVSRRAPAPDVEQPDRFAAMEGLDDLLAESDYVLVTLPLDDSTQNLFDAGRFAAMKPDGVLINVGRGRVIDERALYDALAEKRIGGAMIDVWYQYPSADDPDPTPSRYPFESLDNVIMTPHCSARSQAMRERRWQFVADNLRRYGNGEEPRNVCLEIGDAD